MFYKKKAEKRKLETPEQANIRKRKTAEKMAEIRKLETSQQHQNRIEKVLDYSRSKKKGNTRNNPINGMSLLNEFEDEISEKSAFNISI